MASIGFFFEGVFLDAMQATIYVLLVERFNQGFILCDKLIGCDLRLLACNVMCSLSSLICKKFR